MGCLPEALIIRMLLTCSSRAEAIAQFDDAHVGNMNTTKQTQSAVKDGGDTDKKCVAKEELFGGPQQERCEQINEQLLAQNENTPWARFDLNIFD